MSSNHRSSVRLILVTLIIALTACTDATETITMHVGGHPFTVELAATEEARARGLMHRESLPPDHGMLFVFPQSALRSFWMRDTPLPLSIAFISADGRILEIRRMLPFDETPVRSRFPARYALEVNQGRFVELGIRPGDRIELEALPDSLRR